jgi:spore maturation protein SpmB
MAAMILNLSANALGLGNAATPLGLKAMAELDKLNPYKGTASNAMCLFLAINTSSVTLLPTGVIVQRDLLGSERAADILPTTLFATLCSTAVAIALALALRRTWTSAADATPPEEVQPIEAPSSSEDDQTAYPAWVSWTAILSLVAAIPLTVLYGKEIAPWIVPGLAAGMLSFGAWRGVPVYEVFIRGAREGWDISARVIPYLVAILCAVGMVQASGLLDAVVAVLDPVTGPLGLPGKALPMALIRPLSGSGALGIMIATMQDPATGPDTYTGFLVSTINGSSETTFYVLAVYFGSVAVKRIRYALACGLAADIAGLIGSIIACQIYFRMNGLPF